MDLKNFYYYFQSALNPEICKNIIDNGNKKIEELKIKGIKTEAETKGQNHKQALEQINKNIEPLNDKSIYEIKEQLDHMSKKKVKVMMSMSDFPEIRNLFTDYKIIDIKEYLTFDVK